MFYLQILCLLHLCLGLPEARKWLENPETGEKQAVVGAEHAPNC